MESLFDKRAAGNRLDADTDEPSQAEPAPEAADSGYTAREVKSAVQELLRSGLLEGLHRLDQFLDLSDWTVFVADALFGDELEQWSHPLVRHQRLTLEQSLLLAILRQQYIAHEQEAGAGAGDAVVELEELLPQLQVYLGDSGSEMKEQKRLRNLLEALRGHGIVSEVDEREQKVKVRPLITHLANPESLQSLLHHFRSLTASEERE